MVKGEALGVLGRQLVAQFTFSYPQMTEEIYQCWYDENNCTSCFPSKSRCNSLYVWTLASENTSQFPRKRCIGKKFNVGHVITAKAHEKFEDNFVKFERHHVPT